jgi:hypothetical protein
MEAGDKTERLEQPSVLQLLERCRTAISHSQHLCEELRRARTQLQVCREERQTILDGGTFARCKSRLAVVPLRDEPVPATEDDPQPQARAATAYEISSDKPR